MLTLYSRTGCHLCHEAESLLERAGVGYRVQDIGGDPDLEAAFGFEIPVLADESGRVLARGRIGEAELTRVLIGGGGSAR